MQKQKETTRRGPLAEERILLPEFDQMSYSIDQGLVCTMLEAANFPAIARN